MYKEPSRRTNSRDLRKGSELSVRTLYTLADGRESRNPRRSEKALRGLGSVFHSSRSYCGVEVVFEVCHGYVSKAKSSGKLLVGFCLGHGGSCRWAALLADIRQRVGLAASVGLIKNGGSITCQGNHTKALQYMRRELLMARTFEQTSVTTAGVRTAMTSVHLTYAAQ